MPEPLSSSEQQFLSAEREVELHSSALKKELRVVDLVGIQILNSVGYSWIGTARRDVKQQDSRQPEHYVGSSSLIWRRKCRWKGAFTSG